MKRVSEICSLPHIIEQAEILNHISSCKDHGDKPQFMCLNDQCESNCLLCPQCLAQSHRTHDYITLKDFLKPNVRKMISTGTSQIGEQVKDTCVGIVDRLKDAHNKLVERNQNLVLQFSENMQKLRHKYPIKQNFNITGYFFDCENAVKLKYILKRQNYRTWIHLMDIFIKRVIDEVQQSLINIINDTQDLLFSQTWDSFENKYQDEVFDAFRQHLHPHNREDPEYFHFSDAMRCNGISLSLDRLQSSFSFNKPNKIGIIADRAFSPQHPKVAFEIVEETKTLVLLSNVLIAIGVCQPSIVKSKGYRHLGEAGSGCYMIGNTGWTYHHKLLQYQRKNIVGWTFGKGDVVEVEIDFNQAMVKFHRRGYFKKDFSMSLAMPKDRLRNLHPCLYFDGEIGSKVRFINL